MSATSTAFPAEGSEHGEEATGVASEAPLSGGRPRSDPGRELRRRRLSGRADEILADLGEDSVSASVRDGEVVLRGSVASTEDRDVVDERVQDVAGIRGIANEIVVRDDAEAEPAKPLPARNRRRDAQR
ncbi:MAG: BON domain-containing protein [Deltaproteobacteria bacterium]|nr:BON domain-containing protein [Deltaproteobacteria bacterium]